METGCVIDMVMGGTGITGLNAMQRAMAADCSRRVVLVAPTGSGKTVAFVIRMLREVVPGRPGVQAVVVVPTRELARQVAGVVRGILNFEGGILNFGDSSAYASARGCNSGEGVNRRPADAPTGGSEDPARLRCASAYRVTNNRRPADACAGGEGTRLETAATMGDGDGAGAAGGCVDGCGMRLETGDNMGDGGGVAKVGLNGGGTPPPLRCTLYINAGRKEKISRGDVAGYVMKQGGLAREEVGRIAVEDHYAMVAVPAERGEELARVLSGRKIKGVRVKVSVIRN